MERTAQQHPSGTFNYLPAIPAYSSGVAAEPGHRVVGLRFAAPAPVAQAMRRIDQEIEDRGLPPDSLAGMHLRSPAVMSADLFDAFNHVYLAELDCRGLLLSGASPLARTNVVPVFGAPSEPCVFAAFLVVPARGAQGDFVVAGSGESVGGLAAEHITAFADVSPAGIRAKAETVIRIMNERLAALGASRSAPTCVDVYTAHDVPGLATLLSAWLPACEWSGYVSYPSRPPVSHIEFEMDCLRVSEWVLLGPDNR